MKPSPVHDFLNARCAWMAGFRKGKVNEKYFKQAPCTNGIVQIAPRPVLRRGTCLKSNRCQSQLSNIDDTHLQETGQQRGQKAQTDAAISTDTRTVGSITHTKEYSNGSAPLLKFIDIADNTSTQRHTSRAPERLDKSPE
jgi:hypothetical protein